MANLKEIKRRINSATSIQQVTKAMKMVAAAKLRRAQTNMLQARPYSSRLRDVIYTLLPQIDRHLLPVLKEREVIRTLFVVITSDRGMAGGFNTNIVREAQNLLNKKEARGRDVICIGRKGRDFLKTRGYPQVSSYAEFWSELQFEHAIKFGRDIVTRFRDGSVDEVFLIYNRFINVIQQEITVTRLLPFVLEEGEIVDTADYLFEPSMADVVNHLVPRYLNIEIWQALLESYASEQAARMTAMDNATNNAGDLIRKMQLAYNKARQATITREILEIVNGAEALKAAG